MYPVSSGPLQILIPPGSLVIQSMVLANDPSNELQVDTYYCTYIPANATLLDVPSINSSLRDDVHNELSMESWTT
jgi:hypothetical protein